MQSLLLAALAAAPAFPAPLPPAQGDHSPSAVLLRSPDVSATQIVFRYAGDLWLCPKEGGAASRLTSAEGLESLPKFSPDGTRVAFMADYDGGSDIYVMDVAGGAPRRVTYHPGRETLCDWHPSGEELLFFSSEESGIARAPKIFRVPVEGGQPVALPIAYGTFCSIDPTGRWIAYTPLSREGRTWRRYRGGMAQDIWLFDLVDLTSVRVTDDPGTDRMPMWWNGQLVFQSDRGPAGVANLYAYDPGTAGTRPLTTLDRSGARFPSVGPDDVVFEQGGELWRLELATGALSPVPVSIPGDRPAVRPALHDLSGVTRNHSLSRTGKRIALEARGDVFSVPVEEGVTRNLTASSDAAERSPSLSPDGRWVAYWSDRSGEYELTLRRADGSPLEGADERGERRLTATGGEWKGTPAWSPDSERIAWSDHDGRIHVLDVEQGLDAPARLLFTAHFPTYVRLDWSPDSSWLAWSSTAPGSRLDALFLCEVESGAVHQVTSALFDDSEPVFSRCGDWLFFHSARSFSPDYADLDGTWIYRETRRLMAVPLRGDVELPWAPENVEEEVVEDGVGAAAGADGAGPDDGDEDSAGDGAEEGEGDSSADVEGSEAAADEPEDDAPAPIELEGFEERAVALDVEPGIAGGLVGLDGAVLFARAADGRATLFRFDLDGDGPAEVVAPVDGYDLSADGEHLLVQSGGKAFVVAPKPGQKLADPVSFAGVRGRYEPREEWAQMIRDVHRMYRDWFYDAGMHGVDWDGLRDRMLSALKDASSREDVHFLIGEMLAELNVGHAYNVPPPGGFGGADDVAPAGLLGADWRAGAGGFELVHLVGSGAETDGRGPLHRLAAPGDVLVAVDGRPVDPTRSIHEHLLGTPGRTVVLTFARDGEERDVVVEPLRADRDLRYRDWVAAKRAWVHEASGGAVGYVHVPSTGIDGQTELYRQFLAERTRKALIVDERWNSGGQIPTRFIELLARRPTNAWAMRDGKVFEWPQVYHDGPKCMLINHSSGSGGDAFPWYFRQRGLGPLIGTRTWGGLVGISGNPALVDGASPSVPTFGFFELDGTWGVEGHGVDPDVEVVDDPALTLDGADPQLETALRMMQAAMADWDYADTERPPSPNRAGAGLPAEDR